MIASGGAGRLEDFRDVLLGGESGGHADAALAASVFLVLSGESRYRFVPPLVLLLTGLTRDGVYLIDLR